MGELQGNLKKKICSWPYNKIYVQKDSNVNYLNKCTEMLGKNGYCIHVEIIDVYKYTYFLYKIWKKKFSCKVLD